MSSKILDDMRDVMRQRYCSIRTERSYCEWVKHFVLHFNMKSRNDLSSRHGVPIKGRIPPQRRRAGKEVFVHKIMSLFKNEWVNYPPLLAGGGKGEGDQQMERWYYGDI